MKPLERADKKIEISYSGNREAHVTRNHVASGHKPGSQCNPLEAARAEEVVKTLHRHFAQTFNWPRFIIVDNRSEFHRSGRHARIN